MKKRFKVLGIVVLCSGSLLGCSVENYFNVYSMMKCPRLSSAQKKVREVIENNLESDFVFYPILVNDVYSSVTDYKFKKGNEEKSFKLVVCKAERDPQELHVLVLKKGNLEEWQVAGEVIPDCSKILKIYIRDVDNNIEMVLCKKCDEKELPYEMEFYNYE